jgi:outer membrane protein OmpA-like peptidoglycan-associated protein
VAYNKRLSLRRADSVANYLEELGVKGSRINTFGYGKSQPRATNSTAEGRQLNRRVEIHVRANA